MIINLSSEFSNTRNRLRGHHKHQNVSKAKKTVEEKEKPLVLHEEDLIIGASKQYFSKLLKIALQPKKFRLF